MFDTEAKYTALDAEEESPKHVHSLLVVSALMQSAEVFSNCMLLFRKNLYKRLNDSEKLP